MPFPSFLRKSTQGRALGGIRGAEGRRWPRQIGLMGRRRILPLPSPPSVPGSSPFWWKTPLPDFTPPCPKAQAVLGSASEASFLAHSLARGSTMAKPTFIYSIRLHHHKGKRSGILFSFFLWDMSPALLPTWVFRISGIRHLALSLVSLVLIVKCPHIIYTSLSLWGF